MPYKFHVDTDDKGYLKLNEHHLLSTFYGKKQLVKFRLLIAVLLAVISAVILCLYESTFERILFAVLMSICALVFVLLTPKYLLYVVKRAVKSMKKLGKLPYTPSADIEFSEDSLTETTDTARTELKYSVIERVTVIDLEVILFHTNTAQFYFLPYSAFRTVDEQNAFLEFIAEKFKLIDYYKDKKLQKTVSKGQ